MLKAGILTSVKDNLFKLSFPIRMTSGLTISWNLEKCTCLKMGGRQVKREKQLSKDTAAYIHHTCCGIVDLAKYLRIDEGYDYVCLGEFTTDPLEKAFSKFRLGSGGAYFINVQQVSKKFRIQKAKLK